MEVRREPVSKESLPSSLSFEIILSLEFILGKNEKAFIELLNKHKLGEKLSNLSWQEQLISGERMTESKRVSNCKRGSFETDSP